MSSSPDTLTAKGEATRARLLEAARASMLETGGLLEVAGVAQRADVSQGLLYRYFESKDGLVGAVVHAFYDSYDAAVFAASLAPGSTWQARERLRLAWEIDFLCDDPLGRLIVGRRLLEPAAFQADRERLAVQIDLAARNVARGQSSGEVDRSIDARLVAAAFLGAFRELMAEALHRDEEPDRALLLDIVWRVGASIIPDAS